MLGTCDEIVPGLVIGALSFGHLPIIFSPAGPMPSGISNKEKAKVREQFALGQVTRERLLKAEAASYHTAGTCTFYGTANSNQMMMELMGLHLPGSAFVNPDTPLREALVRAAAAQCVNLAKAGGRFMAEVVSAESIVNAIVGLMATGGSTNHALHVPAMAQAAGLIVDWNDFSKISSVVPLLTRIYPNGSADINQFHAAGGMAFITRELLSAGLLHGDTVTVAGAGLAAYTQEPWLDDGKLAWRPGVEIARRNHPAACVVSIRNGRRHPPAHRQCRTWRHQDLVGAQGPPHHRRARCRLREPVRIHRSVQGRQARP